MARPNDKGLAMHGTVMGDMYCSLDLYETTEEAEEKLAGFQPSNAEGLHPLTQKDFYLDDIADRENPWKVPKKIKE